MNTRVPMFVLLIGLSAIAAAYMLREPTLQNLVDKGIESCANVPELDMQKSLCVMAYIQEYCNEGERWRMRACHQVQKDFCR